MYRSVELYVYYVWDFRKYVGVVSLAVSTRPTQATKADVPVWYVCSHDINTYVR